MHEALVSEKPLFLETTIQIDRVIGEDDRRSRVERNMLGRVLCTSGHVLAEYNRTLIKDAIVFRNLLITSPNMVEAVGRFTRSYARVRRLPRTVNLLMHLGFDGDSRIMLCRLERFIEWQALDLFWEKIDKTCYVDEVKCPHREWQAEQDDEGRYDVGGLTCLKANPPECGVGEFIEGRRDMLGEFASAGRSCERKRVSKAAKLLDAILEGQDVASGTENCSAISDVLIVLEAAPEAEIYSNDGDVQAICEMVDKDWYSEVASEV